MSAGLLLGVLAALLSAAAAAQVPPRVSFEGSVVDYAVGARQARLSFVTALPDGYHVNSDAPLEEFLKPTRLLLETPDGVSVVAIRYPKALMFKTRFSEQPLSVYEQHFEIGATLDLPGLEPGDYPIEAMLKYQACSERICYPPTTRSTQIVLPVRVSDD